MKENNAKTLKEKKDGTKREKMRETACERQKGRNWNYIHDE